MTRYTQSRTAQRLRSAALAICMGCGIAGGLIWSCWRAC